MSTFRSAAHRHAEHMDITRGVRSVTEGPFTLGMAGERSAALAERAAASGTFGVGGLMLARGGRVISEAVNAVIVDGVVRDPTAHVERQLIDWYYKNWKRLDLAEPQELVIFSSLDPCAMCAGAILKAGFNAVSVAYDQGVGIHEQGMRHLNMHPELWERADRVFDVFPSNAQHRDFFVPLRNLGIGATVDTDSVIGRSLGAFTSSFDTIREAIGSHEGSLGSARRDAGIGAFESLPPGIELPTTGIGAVQTLDRQVLGNILSDGRACMIDQTGRIVLIAKDAQDISPIRSSIMELIRAYTYMSNSPKYSALDLPAKSEVSFLVYRAPQAAQDALMQLGALGSFLESPREAKAFPLLSYVEGSEARMQEFISHMSWYYKDHVKVSAGALYSALRD